MAELSGGNERIDLGGGYALRAPGLRGRAEIVHGSTADRSAREGATTLVEEVMAGVDMDTVKTVEIEAREAPGAAAPTELRDAQGRDALLLEVPDLGPEAGQVVLEIDEAGALSWHFPLDGGEIQGPVDRGAGGTKRFYIPRAAVPAPTPAEAARDRALFGALGRKLLKVIVYPITDALLGRPARAIAEHWEKANRAYAIRGFTRADYRDGSQPYALSREVAQGLAAGRALLFLHGTFSTAHGAFHDVDPELMDELHQRYGGRVFAFNHFSMAHDPLENVEQLLAGLRELAPGAAIEVDIVCHSRGGLVARTLAEGRSAFGLAANGLSVRRVVFAAVPNQGTLLAQPDHMVHMIDRLTTGLNFVPPGGVADVLEGLLIAVKIIGHGALKGLDGLRSMDPEGDFLGKLNSKGNGSGEYFAVAADYEPSDSGLKALVRRSVDALMDRVFENSDNDLVVPESGVYGANGSGGFPIAPERCLRLPGSEGVMHTGLFGHRQVGERLKEWLTG